MKDEMKIVTPFLKGILAKAAKKVIREKLGYDLDISLNDIYISTDENGAHVHINANADMPKKDLDRLVSSIL